MIKLNETLEKRVIHEKDYGDDPRDAYLRDRDRILFSRAFRRLAFKTQVVSVYSKEISDHIRSRLTHSLEVMQIASSIALEVRNKNNKNQAIDSKEAISKKFIIPYCGINHATTEYPLNLHLIQAIALGHDIGHTPYGHVGEEAMFEFLFSSNENIKNIMSKMGKLSKLRHCFQSIKVCCFLEKQYLPDFYGLNLTIGTLDGIFKHSNMKYDERQFYRQLFELYCDEFWSDSEVKVDEEVINKLKTYLFEYSSPVTLEGVIVAIADEIAQMCHDVEDLRRIGGFDFVEHIYDKVKEEVEYLIANSNIDKSTKKIFNDFKESLEYFKNKKKELIRLERLYIKLMINLSLLSLSDIIKSLMLLKDSKREQILKNDYLGKFEKLETVINNNELNTTEDTAVIINVLKNIFNEVIEEKNLLKLQDIARWDIKGREICIDLATKLLESFKKYEELSDMGSHKKDKDLMFNIVNKDLRDSLLRSYNVGKRIGEKIPELGELKDLPLKIAVWDYIAGMTDSYIIKEYESLTFKKVSLY